MKSADTLLNRYQLFCGWYKPQSIYTKTLILHRAFFELYLERMRISKILDSRIPLHLTEKEICTPKVSNAGLSGFRILHLSDLHLDGSKKLLHRLIHKTQGIDVDLIALTGDYHKGQSAPHQNKIVISQIVTVLNKINSKYGAIAVLGNHDNPQMVSEFEQVKIKTLWRHSLSFSNKGIALTVSGYDSFFRYPKDHRPNNPALTTLPSNCLNITLCHYPHYAPKAARLGYDIYLTGHTHGPQIPLPAIRRLVLKDKLQHLSSGIWTQQEMKGHTSRGIGTSILPIRVRNKAEVTILTLR